MTYRGLYIDDMDEGSAEILSGSDLKFSSEISLCSLPELAQKIREYGPDILAIDYRLDENQEAYNRENTYRAGGVAQLLREVALENPKEDFPIIMVSNENKISTLFSPDKTAHDLFDEWYSKESIAESRCRVQRQAVSLIEGYKAIADWRTKGHETSELFSISRDAWHDLSVGDFAQELEEPSIPTHVIARHILRKVVLRTGILLNTRDISARLGIDPELSKMDEIMDEIGARGIMYTGVFSSGWKRAWRHRFNAWAADFFGAQITSLTGIQRAQILEEKGFSVKPAISKWTKSSKEFFALSCASCDYPTEQMNSVAALDSDVPSFVDRKRICFHCVMTDHYEKKKLKISSIDEPVVCRIKSGSLKEGGA